MSSIDRIYIGRQARTLDIAPEFDGYSKVILNVTDDLYYEAGVETGRTLTLFNPFGTKQMCNDILAKIKGYKYQPMDAQDAIIDPAAELGDGVTVKDTYSIIASLGTTFGPLLRANVSAPGEEEIDHEYPYKSPQERKVTRQFANVRSSLQINADAIAAEVEARQNDIELVNAQMTIQAGQIAAKVSKTGGNNASFGWEMTDSYMVWKANNSEIFRLDKNGAKVTGEIIAKSGQIGGLAIKNNSLTYNNQTWGGTNSTGIYLGPSGLQLGVNFRVDNSGNISASSGEFSGTVRAGSIVSDGVNGYGGSFSGAGLASGSLTNSRIASGTIQAGKTAFSTSISRAESAYGVVYGGVMASSISSRSLYTTNLTAATFEFDTHGVRWRTITTEDGPVTVLARK